MRRGLTAANPLCSTALSPVPLAPSARRRRRVPCQCGEFACTAATTLRFAPLSFSQSTNPDVNGHVEETRMSLAHQQLPGLDAVHPGNHDLPSVRTDFT